MIALEQTLLEANKRRYDLATNPLKSHGPDHHWRVYQHTVKLAEKLGVEYDPETLAGAALLHDMAAYYPERTGEEYHDFDHQIAKEVLEEIGFPKDKIDAVLDAIAHHGSDPKFKQAHEPIETTLLRDADKLDVFGPIGVARIIMVRTLKGDTLPEIVADFYTGGHLQRKWESISTSEARGLAQADYEYSQQFFARLAESLEQAVESDATKATSQELTGDIIEESLADKATLQDVKIVSTRVEPVTPEHKTPWLKQWTLHTIAVPEAEGEKIAESLSHALETEHTNWYIDFKNDATHYVIFPSKVFKVDRSQPEQYKPVVSYGVKWGIPRHQLDFSPEIKYWERPA